MIEENIPTDHLGDDFYERFMEQRGQELSHPSTTEVHDFFPFPIQPLHSDSSTDQRKRLDAHSGDSRVTSPLAFSRSPAPSPATSIDTSTPPPPGHLLHDQPKLLDQHQKELLDRFNNLFATVPNCVPKSLNKLFALAHRDFQLVLRTLTRRG